MAIGIESHDLVGIGSSLSRRLLILLTARPGPKIIPSGDAAIELLQKAPAEQSNPFVFPSSYGTGRLVGLQKIWLDLRSKAGLESLRLHDLRRQFLSVGACNGESLYILGKLEG